MLLFWRFGFQGFEFAAGDVAAEGFQEILLQVAFGDGAADAKGRGMDAVRTQLPGDMALNTEPKS